MKKFVVISHTHWDREWYMSFSSFRLKLVDLIDRLLGILDNDSSYIFHLDAQTVVLEDYLELRPNEKDRLIKFISSGNIVIGPWYLQNDFYLTSGESTVRNLQLGRYIAEQFGRRSNVGYAPDQFGNVTQLPQILKGFGIDNFVFGRGFSKYATEGDGLKAQKLPAEFLWEGPDGTTALAIHLKCWYNNAQHIPAELDLAKLLLDINEKAFEGLNVSPYILLMNGVDHLEAQSDVREIVCRLREEGYDIEQTTLDQYVSDVKKAVEGKPLYIHKGALNMDVDNAILKGCWSSRIYLKRENVKAEDLLINKLEPVYAYLESNGFKGVYPTHEMNYLWKNLLKNHPHDSICGCSIDSVHKHMEDSFEQIEDMGSELLSRGMKIIALHSNHPMKKDENYSVTVFNPTERIRSDIVEATLYITEKEGADAFAIYDACGNEVPYEIVSEGKELLDVFSPVNLPGYLDVYTYKIRFIAEKVPAYSSAIYACVLGKKPENPIISHKNDISNEFYNIGIEGDSLVIYNKKTGRKIVDPFLIEECVDRGDAYVYRPSDDKARIIRPGSFEVVCGGLAQKLKLSFKYASASHYNFSTLSLSDDTVEECIDCELALGKGGDIIAISYNIDNRIKDRRLRLLIDCGISNGVMATDSAYDYAVRQNKESCEVTASDTHANSTFATVSCKDECIAVFTEGQHEIGLEGKYAALTILRVTGAINRSSVDFQVIGGKTWVAENNQCIRNVWGRFGVAYVAENNGAKLWSDAKFFRNGFIVHSDSFDYRKYSGGRFAVQSAELEKLYYVPDKYENCCVSGEGVVTVEGENIAITCVKGGILGEAVIRLVNLSDANALGKIYSRGNMYVTQLDEIGGNFVGDSEAEIEFGPHEIKTVKVKYE